MSQLSCEKTIIAISQLELGIYMFSGDLKQHILIFTMLNLTSPQLQRKSGRSKRFLMEQAESMEIAETLDLCE